MNHPRAPFRSPATGHRGVALLLVLAALVLIMSAAVALASAASTAKLQRDFHARTLRADDTLIASEAPILEWLATKSTKVVLPPDAPTPCIEVMQETILPAAPWLREPITLTVAAWDQLGMVPMRLARSGSPLRLSLPDHALRMLDRVELPPPSPSAEVGTALGLDMIIAALEVPDDVNVFPKSRDDEAAIGALLATHNDSAVNVNTAPLHLLQAALRAAGMGGIESIAAARAEGRLAPAPAPPRAPAPTTSSPAESAPGTGIALVSASGTWAFRTDITIGPLTRSWWSIYEQRSTKWELVQRLAIAE